MVFVIHLDILELLFKNLEQDSATA